MLKVRLALARWLRRLAEWLDPADPRTVTVTVVRDELFMRAQALCRHEDVKNPELGFGQAKRRNVYAQLKKDFPERSHREVSLVLEVAGR